MKAFFKLFNRFVVRALRRDLLRAALTALGISLGVGVIIAIRLANLSALESFRAATESIAGSTSIQIKGAAGRFDELQARQLDWLREYGQPSPVIEGVAMLESDGAASGDFLHVLGVDVLKDRDLRDYELLQLDRAGQPTRREFLSLLEDARSIIITEKLARRRGLNVGDRLPLQVGDARHEFTVRGLLLDRGPARALDGNFALMDIAAAQWAFDRLGRLDRLDVKLKPGVALDRAESEIAARLPKELVAARPEAAYGQVEKMIAAFHFNLNALASIALLVGLFLIYNTVSISVITRRGEIGTLRAVGAGRRAVLALFLGEAVLLAVVGTLVGLVLGRLMAGAAVRATATTVETFYIATAATESMARQALSWADALIAFAITLPLALLAAAVPALEASRVRPVEAMRGAERLAKSFRPARRHLLIAALLFALGYGLSRLDTVNGLPVFGYLSALALMFGGAFLVPSVLWMMCRLAARGLGWFRVESKLAAASLGGAIPRVSISVAALAVSLAMMVSISIMIGSFRETVAYWVEQTLKADIYARPVMRDRAGSDVGIADEALRAVAADPEVAALDTFTGQEVSYEGQPITVGANEFNVLLDHGRLAFKSPADARRRIREAVGQDAVAISESFSLRFNKQPGDTVELPTSAGPHPFRVAAVYYDYSNNRGVALMDRSTFARHYAEARPESLAIYLRPGAEPEAARERLAGALGGRFALIFTTNAAVRAEVARIFDSTFAITQALRLIAITVAGLGVLSTLIALILERRGEFAVLSFLGASRSQIRRMVVIEAVMLGGTSQLIGVLIGALLSLILIYVINVQSFGWTIQFHFPLGAIVQSTALILMATGLAGLYPATRAARVDAVRFAREE